MDSKQENLQRIVRYIAEEPRTWREILDQVDVSEATLSRYIKELKEKGLLYKQLGEEDEILYCIDPTKFSESEEVKNQLVKQAEQLNKALEYLQEYGLFDEGMDHKDILEFLGKHGEEFDKVIAEPEDTKENDNLDIFLWNTFNMLLTRALNQPDVPDIKVKISVEGEKEDFEFPIDRLRNNLDEFGKGEE